MALLNNDRVVIQQLIGEAVAEERRKMKAYVDSLVEATIATLGNEPYAGELEIKCLAIEKELLCP